MTESLPGHHQQSWKTRRWEQGQKTQNGQRSQLSKKKMNSRVKMSNVKAGAHQMKHGFLAGWPESLERGSEDYPAGPSQRHHRKEGGQTTVGSDKEEAAGPGAGDASQLSQPAWSSEGAPGAAGLKADCTQRGRDIHWLQPGAGLLLGPCPAGCFN